MGHTERQSHGRADERERENDYSHRTDGQCQRPTIVRERERVMREKSRGKQARERERQKEIILIGTDRDTKPEAHKRERVSTRRDRDKARGTQIREREKET